MLTQHSTEQQYIVKWDGAVNTLTVIGGKHLASFPGIAIAPQGTRTPLTGKAQVATIDVKSIAMSIRDGVYALRIWSDPVIGTQLPPSFDEYIATKLTAGRVRPDLTMEQSAERALLTDAMDILDWDVRMEEPPAHMTRTIGVRFAAKGRSAPIPADNPWSD